MEFDLNKRHCYWFNELCKIPHGSRNEKALSDFIVDFAKAHGFDYKQDEVWNVIIDKKASEGYENAPGLILQAHMDMVCEKNRDCDLDFEKDPLDLYVEDGLLKAKGTTLGADDGTGVAYMLAILEDDSLKHPRLSCIFTTMEEIGLLGAAELKPEDVHADRMISLDGGGECHTLLSSAGGGTAVVKRKVSFEANEDPVYCLEVKGLLGGHSGGDIHLEKGNANKLAARILKEMVLEGADVRLVSFEGGMKDNAIPREASVVFASTTDKDVLKEAVSKKEKQIWKELEFSDAGFKTVFSEVSSDKKMTKKDSEDVLNMIYLMPNGFKNRSMVIEGLTTASLNLGVVRTADDTIELDALVRAALDSHTDDMLNQIAVLSSLLDMDFSVEGKYPGWSYSEVSPMRDIFAGVAKANNKELEVTAAHGGCECGVFKGLNPNIDIISFGPITRYIHTPDEELDLESFDRSYGLLCEIIEACK
ncbi:MAG: beta-Ala-His dipeptidase [Erysipelotrichaceae bacterium]|nr:beta-Ala-His dipeptidase [Erysipelotrichaceae bacterium]